MPLSTNEIVSLVGIIVTAAVALAVAYMHRKQMRQLELYRQNPEAGVVPPLHPVTNFLKNFGLSIVILCIFPIFVLVQQATRREPPVSRTDVIVISYYVVMLVLGICLILAKAVRLRMKKAGTSRSRPR